MIKAAVGYSRSGKASRNLHDNNVLGRYFATLICVINAHYEARKKYESQRI